MPQRLNTILNITAEELDKKDVFNAFVDVDSKLYVDPSLLHNCRIPELKNSHANLEKYFEEILTLVDNSKRFNDIFWKHAFKRLQFKEFKPVALGYSVGHKAGNAIGPKIATNLLITAQQIINAGIKDPIIFELIGLFEEGVGADRISDMTIHIIKDDLIKYTQRVCSELSVPQIEFGRAKKTMLPYNPKTREAIVFTPKSILQDLPIAFSWEDIDTVCQSNEDLRNRINSTIGNSWKYATSKVSKSSFKRTLIENPEAFKDLINQYRNKPKTSYNFKSDPSGQVIWADLSEQASKDYPVDLSSFRPITSENMLALVKVICNQFGKLIESNGWFEFLYDDKGKLRHERFPQKLFYGIADQYCLANDLNLSREPNAGSGALDFKISRGYNTLVTVEVKYSSNPNLIKGFTTQLPIYNKAENAKESIYLVLRTTKTDKSIKSLQKVIDAERKKNLKIPEVIFIDARPKESASHR